MPDTLAQNALTPSEICPALYVLLRAAIRRIRIDARSSRIESAHALREEPRVGSLTKCRVSATGSGAPYAENCGASTPSSAFRRSSARDFASSSTRHRASRTTSAFSSTSIRSSRKAAKTARSAKSSAGSARRTARSSNSASAMASKTIPRSCCSKAGTASGSKATTTTRAKSNRRWRPRFQSAD